MVAEVGVVISEGEKQKNGGSNYQNRFGKTSIKDYEKMRQIYLKTSSMQEDDNLNEKTHFNIGKIKSRDMGVDSYTVREKFLSKPKAPPAKKLRENKLPEFNLKNYLENDTIPMTNFDSNVDNVNIFKNRKASDLRKVSSPDKFSQMNEFNFKIISNINWGRSKLLNDNINKYDENFPFTKKLPVEMLLYNSNPI